MSLICESELLVIVDIVDVVRRLLNVLLTIFALAISSLFDWFDLCNKVLMLVEELVGIYTGNDVDRNIWSLVFEPTMDIDCRIN